MHMHMRCSIFSFIVRTRVRCEEDVCLSTCMCSHSEERYTHTRRAGGIKRKKAEKMGR